MTVKHMFQKSWPMFRCFSITWLEMYMLFLITVLFMVSWSLFFNICGCTNVFTEYEDEVAHWWSTVLAVACNWLLGEDTTAENLYSKLENIPEVLHSVTDPLPKSVFAAFMARRTFISNRCQVSQKVILRQCAVASQLLNDSLTYNSCKQEQELVLVSLKKVIHFYKPLFMLTVNLLTGVHCSCIACLFKLCSVSSVQPSLQNTPSDYLRL